jgi:hypothetical protein
MPHAPYTGEWPEEAFKPPASPAKRAGSGGSAFSEGVRRRAASLVRPSKARHPQEVARLANPVIASYLVAETYADYRGIIYKARAPSWRRARRLCCVCRDDRRAWCRLTPPHIAARRRAGAAGVRPVRVHLRPAGGLPAPHVVGEDGCLGCVA